MIAKTVKGKGFRGVLDYALRQEKGHILDSNMSGDTPQTLAREFGEIRALRPNLTKAVCHTSISIGPPESLTDTQWQDIGHKFLADMGFCDNQFVLIKHVDTEHQHIHIIANRISVNGHVVSDSHDYKRQEVIMRRLEKEYGLNKVTLSKDVSKKTLSKGEIENVLRTGRASVRTRLQNLVDDAVKKAPALSAFIGLLAGLGVETKLNQASTGKINGISFALDGVALKGSDLGKAYTWNSLQKRGVTYEQAGYSAKHQSGVEQGTPDSREGVERGGDSRIAPEALAAAGHGKIEEQLRIDENFERLARAYKGCNLDRPTGRSRSQGLSR